MKNANAPTTKPSAAEIGGLVGLVKGMDRENQNLVLGIAIGLGLREGKSLNAPAPPAARPASAV